MISSIYTYLSLLEMITRLIVATQEIHFEINTFDLLNSNEISLYFYNPAVGEWEERYK